jgi:hypothetical protein
MRGRRKRLLIVVARWCTVFGLLAVAVLTPVLADDGGHGTSGPQHVEFNGDQYADLAVGTPQEDIGSTAIRGGSVSVVYGASGGLGVPGNDYLTQNLGAGGTSDHWDRFGEALAIGDFDGDGLNDLAIGVPGETIRQRTSAGAVNVVYGNRPNGLDLETTRHQFLVQGENGVEGEAEKDDEFGYALAVGDFQGDGFDDLAVGVPGQDVGAAANAGAVHIFTGSAAGLSVSDPQYGIVTQESPSIEDWPSLDDEFGRALAVGDFDGDGIDDLAVGVPGEDCSYRDFSGGVNVIYGGHGGPYRLFVQNDLGENCEEYDAFGETLAAGDFNADGYDDLAVGVPSEDMGTPLEEDVGMVHILEGSSEGIRPGTSVLHQDSPDIAGLTEPGDRFGDALIAGDFDRNGCEDLAIGVPKEDWLEPDTGIVEVVYCLEVPGRGFVLRGPDQVLREGLEGLGMEEEGEEFGYALAAGDFDGDGYDDLAVGVPGQNVGAPDIGIPIEEDAGKVTVLHGSDDGIALTEPLFFHQGPALQGKAEEGDRFGDALAASRPRPSIPVNGDRFVYMPMVLRNSGWEPVHMSDRNLKDNFAAVDRREVLARVGEMPISTWNYTFEDPAIRHIGPMAQDFYAAFGVGEDDRHIFPLDATGVSLAAVQGLYELVLEKDRVLSDQRLLLRDQQALVADLEARIVELESARRQSLDWSEAWFLVGGVFLAAVGVVVWSGRQGG